MKVDVQQRMLLALLAGMQVVRRGQLFPEQLKTQTKKADDTIVTVTDRSSEKAMVAALGKIRGYTIQGEEGTRTGKGRRRIIFDPLDGTSIYANGGITSTVIIAKLDEAGLVCSCYIGEPISGRVLTAERYKGAFSWLFAMNRRAKPRGIGGPIMARVWPGELGRKTAVLTDHTHGFTRAVDGTHRLILTDKETQRFHDLLAQQATNLKLGTNGGHQLLVANGGERVAGSVTLALGGAWDVAGALLVLEAGGAARAFHLNFERELVERNPLDVFNYDILVTGNSPTTVNTLVNLLRQSISK